MALAHPAAHRLPRANLPSRREKRQRRVLASPRLSVVVVNYRQWESTAGLVRQVLSTRGGRSGAVEVMVVDNHSPAHPIIPRLRRWPGVSLRRWGGNRGFARAVNEGCRLSRGQWFLLLNPDVTVTREFMAGVLALADRLSAEEPRAGIVGFRLRNADGSGQLSSGPFPSLWRTLTGLVVPRWRRKYQRPESRQRCEVPWVTGCCLLIRRDCWHDLGGLDNDFFLYYEDVDLCRRAWARGWSVFYEPALQVVHHHPLHGRAVSPRLRLVTRHALLTYAARHWPGWQFRLMARIVRLEAGVRQLAAWCRGDREAAACFAELGALAGELREGHQAAGRRRLLQMVRRAEATGVA